MSQKKYIDMLAKMMKGTANKEDIADAIELADKEIKEWKIFKKQCESLLKEKK